MKAAKCTSCGANIEVDETKEAGVCKFCNTPHSTEKAIKNYDSSINNNAGVINNYFNQPAPQKLKVPRTERPKIHVGLAIILCCFYLVPGIIYIALVKRKQREWDDKYTY